MYMIKKAVFITIFVLSFVLISCDKNSQDILDGSNEYLSIIKCDAQKYNSLINHTNTISSEFKSYDDIFLNKDRDYSDEKYSNFTKDHLFRWDIKENRDFTSNKKIFDNIPAVFLNEKEVTFPLDFAYFGEEYYIYDRFDFSLLKSDYKNVIVKNNSTGSFLALINYEEEFYKSPLWLVGLYDSSGKYIASLYVETNSGNIIGCTDYFTGLGQISIKAKDICAGKTLNQMYSSFGSPHEVILHDGMVIYRYTFSDINEKSIYFISFMTCELAYNPSTGIEEKVAPNTILSTFVNTIDATDL